MSKNKNYNDGWRDGFWVADGKYMWGYEDGKRAERDRIKRAIDGDPPASETSTLGSMIGGSIAMTLIGWCFVGLILLLSWIGGESGSWWFPWIWRIAFWGGIGFVVIMSIVGIIMAIAEYREAKNPLEKPADDPNMPWYKKYPPADVIKEQKKK